jgi:hypothetical protein
MNVLVPFLMLPALLLMLSSQTTLGQAAVTGDPDLWDLAQKHAKAHRFSTLFTAQDVRGNLSDDEGRKKALEWCRKTAVTHVYVESFRDGYAAERTPLMKVKELFEKEGFLASGCITPTRVGKSSTGWKDTISCYTDKATQEKLRSIFEYAAGMFNEIMIDDFWFTDCTCPECDTARMLRRVTVGGRVYPVSGDTWEDYRCELMVRLSQDYLLKAAKRVNPKARLIIKYPQWYDRFHDRGYEVIRETADFDKIWVGTETRDYADARWGGTPQYEAYFIMRWLGGIGGKKCGGGWFDPYGTRESTYLEQACQTVLAGARESVLFCYGSLLQDTGPNNILALRTNVPGLLAVAEEVAKRKVVGVAAYKPANSHPDKEARVFDFVGMLGLPLVPCHEFPAGAPAAFFSVHAMKDRQLVKKLQTFVDKGKPVLLTDGLVKELQGRVNLQKPNVRMVLVKDDPKSLLELPDGEVQLLREHLMAPLKTTFRGPKKVGFYLFKDRSWVVENFNDAAAVVELNGSQIQVPPRDWICHWR